MSLIVADGQHPTHFGPRMGHEDRDLLSLLALGCHLPLPLYIRASGSQNFQLELELLGLLASD